MAAATEGPLFALAPVEPGALLVTRKQVDAARADPQVQEFSRALARYVAAEDGEELASYERFAVLGVCAGFAERHLSPYVAEHIAIVPDLLAEIRAVYAQVRALGTPYDPEEFRARAFHYGLHKASYLDWRLYLSKECY